MDRDTHSGRPAWLEEELSQLSDDERAAYAATWDLLETPLSGPTDVPPLDEAWADVRRRTIAASEESGREERLHDATGEAAASDRPKRNDQSLRRDRIDRRPSRSRTSRRRPIVAAALVAVVVSVGLWIWQLPVSLTVPPGETDTVTLADGSAVHMNSGSQLTYRPRVLPLVNDRRRIVELDGEAFFDVTPSERPFVVSTALAVVEVLGTRFNVRARSHGDDASVTLESGRVRVSARSRAAASTILSKPGETAIVRPAADSSLVTEFAQLDYVLAWRRDAFAAVDRVVGSILADVERRYALRIDVEGSLALDDSMTLLYGPGTTAERILHDICLVQGCRYRPTTQGFALYMPGP